MVFATAGNLEAFSTPEELGSFYIYCLVATRNGMDIPEVEMFSLFDRA